MEIYLLLMRIQAIIEVIDLPHKEIDKVCKSAKHIAPKPSTEVNFVAPFESYQNDHW
jgi:hypothetical protein